MRLYYYHDLVITILAAMAEYHSDNSLDSSQRNAEEVFRKKQLLLQTFAKWSLFSQLCRSDNRSKTF